MSKIETNTNDDRDEQHEQMNIAEGVVIEDAFVNWWVNAANVPELYVVTNEPIPQTEWQPVECDPDEDYWVDQNDYGVWHGWQNSLPVSEETGMQTSSVEHAEIGTVEDRYRMFDHVVSDHVNDSVPYATATVKFITGKQGSIQTFAVWVGVIQEIIDRYVNGDLGTENTSLWTWKRSNTDWNWSSSSKEDYDGYRTPEVVLVKDRISAWHPKRREDITDEDQVFQVRDDL